MMTNRTARWNAGSATETATSTDPSARAVVGAVASTVRSWDLASVCGVSLVVIDVLWMVALTFAATQGYVMMP